MLFNHLRRRRERFPRLLSIELCSVCNANCIMCPQSDLTRPKRPMKLDLLEKITRDCQGQPLQKINLFWMGESFCHREILDALRIVRRRLPRVKLYISTNSELLHADRARAIIDEGLLDVINFDIDGLTRATYESVRKQVDFDVMIENVRFFLDYRQQQGARKPQTRVTIIEMRETEAEIARFVAHWRPLVDVVDVNCYNTWLGSQEDRNVGAMREKSANGGFDFACRHPWDELVIAADGTAGLCCLDYDLKTTLGSVHSGSISDIWQSGAIQSYRRQMLAGQYQDLEVCKDCNAHIFQDRSTWAKLQR